MDADLRGWALAGIACLGLAGCGAPDTVRATDGAPSTTDGGGDARADAQAPVDASDAGMPTLDANTPFEDAYQGPDTGAAPIDAYVGAVDAYASIDAYAPVDAHAAPDAGAPVP